MIKDTSKPVLVTGGTGYLASWIVKLLLDKGFRVNTTVRNLNDKKKYLHLSKMAENFPGKLVLFEADLLKKGSFNLAMQNCDVVIHTASPFKISGIKNAQTELVMPALEGVKNVLDSVNNNKMVKRVVLTSSIAAIYGDLIDVQHTENDTFTEEHWNTTTSVKYQPYSYSKMLAEREAWKICGEQSNWDLVVINPGFILGPSLSPRTDSTSIAMISMLASGKFRLGVPKFKQVIADVRDVAQAHILAAFKPEASGRHIVAPHQTDFLNVAQIIKKAFPEIKLPNGYLPDFLFLLVGRFWGFPPRYIRQNTGFDFKFDNTKVHEKLGLKFRPLDETICDHVSQIKNDRII